MNLELEGGAVVAGDLEGRRCVFLAALYRAEREIAEKLKTLAAGKPHQRLGDAGVSARLATFAAMACSH